MTASSRGVSPKQQDLQGHLGAAGGGVRAGLQTYKELQLIQTSQSLIIKVQNQLQQKIGLVTSGFETHDVIKRDPVASGIVYTCTAHALTTNKQKARFLTGFR